MFDIMIVGGVFCVFACIGPLWTIFEDRPRKQGTKMNTTSRFDQEAAPREIPQKVGVIVELQYA